MDTILSAQIEGIKPPLVVLPLLNRIIVRGQKEQWQAYFGKAFPHATKRLKKGTFHKGCDVFCIQ